jgi:hypothetical protein
LIVSPWDKHTTSSQLQKENHTMKKHTKKVVTAVALASISVASVAAAQDFSIYGASAQFDFINETAVAFVKTYCTTTVPATGKAAVIQYKTALGNTIKNGIVNGTVCTTPGATLNFRINGFGSIEGVTTRTGLAPMDPELATGCNVALNERLQAPDGTSASVTLADGVDAAGNAVPANQALYVAATVCKPVNVGTTDVAWNQFDQTATDELVSADGLNHIPAVPVLSAPANDNDTLAVPFAFYVSPNVKAYHCVNAAGVHTGGYCTPAGLGNDSRGKAIVANSDQCATGSTCEATPSRIDNISRLQANILFSAQALNWDKLGDYFTNNPVKLCLRKPGSGTAVGFDKTVMRAAGQSGNWGSDLVVYTNNDLANALPYTNFAGSTTDMKNCIGGTENFLKADGSVVPFTGAIGYMDADNGDSTTTAPLYNQVAYNGVKASRTNIRNGAYEFYTIGHMYTDGSTLANDVVAYVKNSANIPSGKAKFWAPKAELNFARGADTAYPAKVTATTILTP